MDNKYYVVAMIAGLCSLACFIMVLVRFFETQGTGRGILGIVFSPLYIRLGLGQRQQAGHAQHHGHLDCAVPHHHCVRRHRQPDVGQRIAATVSIS
jgi:hypothetical protein